MAKLTSFLFKMHEVALLVILITLTVLFAVQTSFADVSPATNSTAAECPEKCKRAKHFICKDWKDGKEGTDSSMWNFNGNFCELVTRKHDWMLSQYCIPSETQKERIFATLKECQTTCSSCLKLKSSSPASSGGPSGSSNATVPAATGANPNSTAVTAAPIAATTP